MPLGSIQPAKAAIGYIDIFKDAWPITALHAVALLIISHTSFHNLVNQEKPYTKSEVRSVITQ